MRKINKIINIAIISIIIGVFLGSDYTYSLPNCSTLRSPLYFNKANKESERHRQEERIALLDRFKNREDVALLCLKCGLPSEVKLKIISQLSQWFEVVEGDEHQVSFKEAIERWGHGYLYYHFVKQISDNQKLDKDFIGRLIKAVNEKDEMQFIMWLKEAQQLASEYPELKMALKVFQSYTDRAQQILLKLKPWVKLDTKGIPLQQYVKKIIVGETYCYDATSSQLRAIIKDELQGQKGKLRPLMQEALNILGKDDYETERFISSIFNGIHCANSGKELDSEFNTLTDKDVIIFSNALDGWKKDTISGEHKSNEEYFYSSSTGLYISRKPLKIDASIIQAAFKLGIKIDWDDEGRIGKISYYNTKRILKELGLGLMTPAEYWKALRDAYNAGDKEMVRELLSNKYAEWLDVIYFKEKDKYFMIEHPAIRDDGAWDREKDQARIKEIDIPNARHAWFRFDDLGNIFDIIDERYGFPFSDRVDKKRNRGGTVFKFWDIYTDLPKKGAIRGYVTSSGTPSLDCAMPLSVEDAPFLMVRACRKELPTPPIDSRILDNINGFIQKYDTAMEEKRYEEFYKEQESLFLLLSKQLSMEFKVQLRKSRENSFIKMREKISDMLGFLRMYVFYKKDETTLKKIDAISKDLFGVQKGSVNYENFKDFIYSSRDRLRGALDKSNLKPIVFVMGHKNPDTDTVISSLFEAYRNHLMNPDIAYIPVVQGARIPDEAKLLLNNLQLSDSILLSEEDIYKEAGSSGQVNWILVDQNVSDVQKFVVSILDHHASGEIALRQDAAKTIEIAGSTTGLVVQRFQGLGVDMTGELARICYGATLMDTENKNKSKMTLKDILLMDNLRSFAGIIDTKEVDNSTVFYQNLMSSLLNTDDTEHLFQRDYKEDWGFGFAVAKMKGVFDRNGGRLKKEAMLNRLVELAVQNNKASNLPITLVKIVDYEDDNETVFKERMYFVFGKDAKKEFRDEMLKLFEVIVRNEFDIDAIQISHGSDYADFIEWSGVDKQLSRKKVAPILQPVVAAFNEYFYSEKLDLYIRRDFLKINNAVKEAAEKLGIKLSENEEGYVNYVTPYDFMRLMREMGCAILSLKDYALARQEAKERRDKQMIDSLEYHGFVDILDTLVLTYNEEEQKGVILEHPEIIKNASGNLEIHGGSRMVDIPRGEPGLIDWNEVNPDTGLPDKVYHFGDDISYKKGHLSRYWSPREDGAYVFTRGSIFIYRITCMDGKVRPDEIQENMGVRPCRRNVTPPKIIIKVQDRQIVTEIISEEGIHTYRNGLLDANALPEDITNEIRQKLIDVDRENHTLDVDAYIKNMIPEKVLAAFKNNKIGKIDIHYGPMTYVKDKNHGLLDGYKDISEVDPDGCLIGWFIKDTADGNKDVIITHIRGESKLLHILYGLRFLGVKDEDISIYDYKFDFEGFAENIIKQGMKGEAPKIVAIGKSIFERKLLRKIKFGKIYQEIKRDMKKGGFTSVEELLRAQIIKALGENISEKDIALFMEFPYVRGTITNMQHIVDEPVSMRELLMYWHYGDITEDYTRIITMFNTGVIEITKFAKMLQPKLENVRISEKGTVIYTRDGVFREVDLSNFIDIRDNKYIRFKLDTTAHSLKEKLRDYSDIDEAVDEIFKFATMFSGLSKGPIKDYTSLPILEELRGKFDIDRVEQNVFDIHILTYPADEYLDKASMIPIGRYPFGELAADFVAGAAHIGAKTYSHCGSCGLFIEGENEIDSFALRPGDLVVPEEICDKNGKSLKKLNIQRIIEAAKDILNRSNRPYRIMRREQGKFVVIEEAGLEENPAGLINIILTKHASVDTPLVEDTKYVNRLKAEGIYSVDCETAKVVERMLKEGLELDYEFMFWVADIPGKAGDTLANEKELHSIADATRIRKVQGLMSDINLFLRLEEMARETEIYNEVPSVELQRSL